MKCLSRFALVCLLAVGFCSTAIVPVSAQATAELPVLVTSIGQSPGPVYFRVFMNRLGYDFKFATVANVDTLNAGHDAGPFRTLIMVTGASGKGMGAAGTSIEDELARAEELIAAARAVGIRIIGAHIEGMERRAQGAAPGDNTDEQSIDAVCPFADMLLVMEEGDEDGRFTNIANEHNLPIVKFERLTDLNSALTDIFGN